MKEYRININGTMYNVSIEEVGSSNETTTNRITGSINPAPQTQRAPAVKQAPTPTPAPATSQVNSGQDKAIKSPLPGIVLDVLVNVGDTVKAGQKVLLLEAMKMENNIEAESDGTVKEIKAKKGDTVYEGDILIIIG